MTLKIVAVENIKTVLTAPISRSAITKKIIVKPTPKIPTNDITEICSNVISNGISNISVLNQFNESKELILK